MASGASQLIEEVTALAQSDSLEDARETCADGTYFPNNQRKCVFIYYLWVYIKMTLFTNIKTIGTLQPYRVWDVLFPLSEVYCIFEEGLMMIPSELKHIAQSAQGQ